jgi:hypothetical protein
MLFAVTPDVFDWIEFGSVSRQILQVYCTVLLGNGLSHQMATMHWQTVPDNRQFTGDMPPQMAQKGDELGSLDAASKELEIEVPDGDAGNGREARPIEGILQHWRLASRRPGTLAMRPFAQAAFVDKHYGSVLQVSFFLSPATALLSSAGWAGSSRWVARPVGRWQLQPKERRIRDDRTWPWLDHFEAILSSEDHRGARPVARGIAPGSN